LHVKIFLIALVFLFALCPLPGVKACYGSGDGSEDMMRLGAEIEAMKKNDPDRYRDLRHALRHIRKTNMAQKESTSLIVAKALVDHVHWEKYRFSSEEHRLNFLSVLMGIIRVESNFDPTAVSNKNARGLMQVHWPTWKRYFSSPEEAHDLRRNLSVGTAILRLYMRQSHNDLRLALYKYVGAMDDHYADKVIANALAFKSAVLSNPLK